MSIQKYHNMYLEYIQDFIKKENKIPDHKIYEYLYALELGLINWDDLPPNFDEKFQIPHKMDYGIDLIDLEYTKSCQVKKYEGSIITWSHLCKFKTYSSDVLNIKDGNIILATTETAKIDKLGQQSLIDSGKIKLLRNDFNRMIEKYLDISIDREEIDREKKVEEREYLIDCYKTIIGLNKKKIKCQLPCGCGKSFIMLYTIQRQLKENNKSKFIIFIPWLDLARQTLDLYKDFNIRCEFIGNGKTRLRTNDYNVIICINPSSVHIDKNINFKYKFIDEAHHLEGNGQIKQKIDKIIAEKEIHFSATFHNTHDIDYNYPLRMAIDNGYVSDYVLHFSFFSKGDRMDALLNMLKERNEYFPMFVYFNSTKRCREFYNKLIENNINGEYLDGNSNTEKRIEVKKRLCNGTLDILSLCGVYNEGVSIDNIRTVVFGDLRHSDINKIQIMMRASRLHKSKPFYRVIIPTDNTDMNGEDIQQIVRTFCKIDSKMKESIKRKSKTRIKIKGLDYKNIEKAELQYEEIYNRLGYIIREPKKKEKKDKVIKDINFTSSKIIKCKIKKEDKLISNKKYYKKVLINIYETMKLEDIKSLTEFNIKMTDEKGKKGYHWSKSLGISIQNKDTNSTIKEIIRMCRINKLQLYMKIKLKNSDLEEIII